MSSCVNAFMRRRLSNALRINQPSLASLPCITCRTFSQSSPSQSIRHRLLFLGAPGVGKGTYSKLIAPSFGAQIMTSSDLLRDAAHREESADGNYILECID